MKISELLEAAHEMLDAMTPAERERILRAGADADALISELDLSPAMLSAAQYTDAMFDYEAAMREIADAGGIGIDVIGLSASSGGVLSDIPPEYLASGMTADLIAEMTGIVSGLDLATLEGIGAVATPLGAISEFDMLGVYGDVTGILAQFHDIYDSLANGREPEWGVLGSALGSTQTFLGQIRSNEQPQPAVYDETGGVVMVSVQVSGADALDSPNDTVSNGPLVAVPRVLIDLMLLCIALLPFLLGDVSGAPGEGLYETMPSTIDAAGQIWIAICLMYRDAIHGMLGQITDDQH